MRTLLILALNLVAAPCMAAGWSEHWIASSTTASAITGDVTLTTTRILFAGGASLPIAKLRNVAFTDDIGRTTPATIYRITTPADPALEQGNRLCGSAGKPAPVTFVVIWRAPPVMPGEPVGRAMAPFSGTAIPAANTDHACGTYRYELARKAGG